MRQLNYQFHLKLKRRLLGNEKAMQYLNNRGLTPETIKDVGLGLSMPYYSKKLGCEHGDALVYPLRGLEGRFYNKYGYYNIPGVTQSPPDSESWMSGEIRTYYSDAASGKKSIFICQSPIDLWRHWQSLRRSAHAHYLLLITSTHSSTFPKDWKNPTFWAGWETVFFGQSNDDVGEQLAFELSALIGRDARRVTVPRWSGKTWTDYWRNGGDIEEFTALMREAPVISLKVRLATGEGGEYGRFAYHPIDINGAFHNGRLYYTTQVLQRGVEVMREEGSERTLRDVERLETVVIRSDRTVQSVTLPSAPKGTKGKDRVLRLTDGTLLDREPQVNRYGTWRWKSIDDYLHRRSKVRPLGEILRDVGAYLKGRAWLPYQEDYSILTLAALITFAQSIFESVPLIVLHGPSGSGATDLGRAMARVGSNAYVCGLSSATSIARSINESRGLAILRDIDFNDTIDRDSSGLINALKLSYNKLASVRVWIDTETPGAQPQNLYGVKVIISRAHDISHRISPGMILIQVRTPPSHLKEEFNQLLPDDVNQLAELRDELHTWTFENASLIAAEYERCYPKSKGGTADVMAPLKVMAALGGDSELKAQLDIALARCSKKTINLDNPTEAIQDALRSLIAQGYDTISVTHLVLEIRSMFGQAYGQAAVNQLPAWLGPERVGRLLRNLSVVDAGGMRSRVRGSNLRLYSVLPSYLEQVRGALDKPGYIGIATREPTGFCRECDTCSYKEMPCEIRSRR